MLDKILVEACRRGGMRIAQCIRAPTYDDRSRLQGSYFACWRDVPLRGLELYACL
jgi:hypothetical protein